MRSVAPARHLRLALPLPQQVSDGGVLRGQRAGEQGHEAPEALPQLLHVLLQAVDVRVQLSPAALHLGQHVVHEALHLHRGGRGVMETAAGDLGRGVEVVHVERKGSNAVRLLNV